MSKLLKPRFLLSILVLSGIILFAKWYLQPYEFHGTYLPNARQVSNFELTGIDQKAFNAESLKNQWTMVFFGFTRCGYLCPTTMAELAKMYRLLEQQNISPLPQVIMVSLDPKRDDLPRLASYVQSFHPKFYGLSGTEQSLQAVTREWGIAYVETQNQDIDHTGTVLLFNPQGKLQAFFTTPHNAQSLVEDYRQLLKLTS